MTKLSIKKTSMLGLLGLLGLFLTENSYAWGKIVFDPSNFGKNTVTAMQQVKQTALQTTTMQKTVANYIQTLQNMKQLNPSIIADGVSRGMIPPGQYGTSLDAITAAKGVYATYENINKNMDGFSEGYSGINDVMQGIDRTSNASKVAPDRILQYDFQRSQQGQVQGVNYYNQLKLLNGQLAQHQKRSDALAASLPAQNGTVQLLQTLGTQNALVSDQLSHLIQVTSINTTHTVQTNIDQHLKDELEARNKQSMIRDEKLFSQSYKNKN